MKSKRNLETFHLIQTLIILENMIILFQNTKGCLIRLLKSQMDMEDSLEIINLTSMMANSKMEKTMDIKELSPKMAPIAITNTKMTIS